MSFIRETRITAKDVWNPTRLPPSLRADITSGYGWQTGLAVMGIMVCSQRDYTNFVTVQAFHHPLDFVPDEEGWDRRHVDPEYGINFEPWYPRTQTPLLLDHPIIDEECGCTRGCLRIDPALLERLMNPPQEEDDAGEVIIIRATRSTVCWTPAQEELPHHHDPHLGTRARHIDIEELWDITN